MTRGTKLDRANWALIQSNSGVPDVNTSGNVYIDNTTGILWFRPNGGSWTQSSGSFNLTDLGDVTLISAADGDHLVYNGSAWVNEASTDFKLYGQTSTTSLGDDSDIMSFTLGDTDYPEIELDTIKSWGMKLTARTIGSSNVGVFKRWQGDWSFIIGNLGDGTANNRLSYGEINPVTGDNIDDNVTVENPVISISGSAAPYTIQVFVEHENITSAKVVDIEWVLEIKELTGVAKGWS